MNNLEIVLKSLRCFCKGDISGREAILAAEFHIKNKPRMSKTLLTRSTTPHFELLIV